MDRLDGMAAFAAVAEAGSFTAAATRLGVSRALVGKRVAALEATLGVRLFDRTTRRVGLTAAGLAFIGRCKDILAAFEDASRLVQQDRLEPAGVLRVNAPMSFGILHLAPLVVAFMKRHPNLQVQMTLTDRFVDLVEEGFDVGVRIGALADSSLVARRLAPARRVVCAAPAYLGRHGAIEAPEDLLRHRCLHYGHLATGTSWPFVGPGGMRTVRILPTFSANNGEVLLQAAEAGLGVALLPTFICGAALAAGRLVQVLEGFAVPEIAVNAIWPSNRLMPAKVRLFVDLLVDRFGGDADWDRIA